MHGCLVGLKSVRLSAIGGSVLAVAKAQLKVQHERNPAQKFDLHFSLRATTMSNNCLRLFALAAMLGRGRLVGLGLWAPGNAPQRLAKPGRHSQRDKPMTRFGGSGHQAPSALGSATAKGSIKRRLEWSECCPTTTTSLPFGCK